MIEKGYIASYEVTLSSGFDSQRPHLLLLLVYSYISKDLNTSYDNLLTKMTKNNPDEKRIYNHGGSYLWKGIKYSAFFLVAGILGIDKLQESLGSRIRNDINNAYQSSMNYLSPVERREIGNELKEYDLSFGDLEDGIKYYLGLIPLNSLGVTKKTKEKVAIRTSQIKEDEGRLEELLDLYDTGATSVTTEIHRLIGKLDARGYKTTSYETKYDKIRTRNEEEAKFYQISNDLIHQISVWCANGCDGKRIAVDAGLYFAKETRDFKPREVNLNEKARELSQHISNGLTENSGYSVRIDLTKYLSTSK